MIKAIVAVDKNWAIGKNNGLLFSIKADMKHFRELTKDGIVACGENTLLSFPGSKPLKGRTTIVLCKEGHEYDDCQCIHDFDSFLKVVRQISGTGATVWIIGGGMLYKSMLPYYDEVIVTKVYAEDPEATVYFPNLDENDMYQLDKVEYIDDIENSGYELAFCTYRSKI